MTVTIMTNLVVFFGLIFPCTLALLVSLNNSMELALNWNTHYTFIQKKITFVITL